jgi:cell wall-associated NlpC family hydrolase
VSLGVSLVLAGCAALTKRPADLGTPGDIVFFDRLRHNGIYIGEGRFIHARQIVQPVGDDQER